MVPQISVLGGNVFDAGASLHLSKFSNTPTHKHAMKKGKGIDPPIFKFEILSRGDLCCKAVRARPYVCTGSGWDCLKWLFVVGLDRSEVWTFIYGM